MTEQQTPADPPTGRRGVVTELPDGRLRLEFRRSWPDGPDEIWEALTGPDRTPRWIGSYEGERAPGGRGTFTMTHEAEPASEDVTIVECDPPRRLVLRWAAEEQWRVDLELSVEAGRTVLVFTQAFATGDGVGDVATGWHWYLDKLDAVVTGRPQPAGWDAFLADVGPAYGRAPES